MIDFIKCQKEHIKAVREMYRNSVDALQQTTNYPKWSDDHPSNEYIADSIAGGEVFACVGDGKILGAAVLSENPEGRYESGDWRVVLEQGEFLVIHTLAVSPDYAGKGIGSFMVDRCIAYAKDNGYKAIRLDVVPGNVPAVNLYKKKGFTFAGMKDLQRNINDIPVFELYEFNIE